MKKERKIAYQDVIDLGFVRTDENDDVFFEIYGFQWILVRLTLWESKKEEILADWDCVKRTVEIIRYKKKSGNILNKIKVQSLGKLKSIIKAYSI